MNPKLQQFVIISATIWSMTMLTLGYLGFAKPDSAFVASVLGGAISAAGLSVGNKQEPPTKKTEDKDAGGY